MANPYDVANAFVRAINEHDVEHLAALMSDDHRFIDALDGAVEGRHRMADAWREYFRMVPDYTIEVEQAIVHGDTVALFGRAGGSCYINGRSLGIWTVPAAWRAFINGDHLEQWQVYADNEPIRLLLNRHRT